MGVIEVQGGYSGRTYRLTIDGDTPTATEAARGQAFVQQQEAQFQQEYESAYGPSPWEDGTALGRGWDRGVTSAYSALGTAAENLGQNIGAGWLENLGAGMVGSAREEQLAEAARLPAPTSRQDISGVGSFLTYAGELAGQSAPEMLAGLAGTAAGGLAGGLPGAIAGGTAVSTPFFYGRGIARRDEEGGDRSDLEVLAGAIGQGALNSIADRMFIPLRAAGVALPAGRNIFTRTVSGAARGAATEVPTEVGQQVIERWQAGLPLDDDEAISEYIDAAVGAAVLGGMFGGAGGVLSRPQVEAPAPAEDPTALPAPAGIAGLLPAPTDAELAAGRRAIAPPRAALPAPGQTTPISASQAPSTIILPAPPGSVRGTETSNVPAPRVPEVAPAPEPAPITVEDLDTAGVPKGAAVYRAAQSGAPQEQVRQAAERYVRSTKSEPRREAVQGLLQRVVDPTTEEAPLGGTTTDLAPEAAQPKITLPDGTTTDVVFFHPNTKGVADIQKSPPRAIVVRDVNGVQVPFYLSTGEGGKAGVPAGKWYPFFGIGGMGWYNKGTEALIADYYGSSKLRAVAESLDAQYGDIRGDVNAAPLAYADPGVFDAINKDMSPSGSPSDPEVYENIAAVVKRVEGDANWPAVRERFIAGARGNTPPTVIGPEAAPEARATPREAFQRAYSPKMTAQMRNNPNLTGVADYADWLGGLSKEQWDSIEPVFQQSDNPFTNAAFIDEVASRQKLERALENAGAEPTTTPDVAKPDVVQEAKLDQPPIGPVRAKLLQGDLRGALLSIGAGKFPSQVKRLAKAIAEYADGVNVEVLNPAVDDVAPLTAPDGGVRPGAFDGQTVYLNAETGMTTGTLLHEMVHVATNQILKNKSHPLTRQVTALMRSLDGAPLDGYAMQSPEEFVAEALTNPDFRAKLAELNMDGTPVTALRRVQRSLMNALRAMVGLQSRTETRALDKADQLFEALLAPGPQYRGTGDLYDTSFAPPAASRGPLQTMRNKIETFGPDQFTELQSKIENLSLPYSWRNFLIRTAVPLVNLADMAKKYLPANVVDSITDVIAKRQTREKELLGFVRRTIDSINDFLKQNPDQVDRFNLVRLAGTRYEIDFRKPLKYYTQWRFYYDEMNPDGTIKRRVHVARGTEEARELALLQHNARSGPSITEGRREPAPDPVAIEAYRELKPEYDALGADGQAAYARALGLFEDIHRSTSRAMKARIEFLLKDSDVATRRSVFDMIQRKILAGQLLEGYQPLQRFGRHWLAYTARDPRTGEIERYKTSFATPEARSAELVELKALKARGVEIGQIDEYDTDRTGSRRDRVPMAFAADVLATVKASGQMTTELEQKLTDLIFDYSPEKSFVQTYRARQKLRNDGPAGVRGFLGDVGPTGQKLGRRDTVFNLSQAGFSNARQLAGLEFSVAEQEARANLKEAMQTYFNRTQMTEGALVADERLNQARLYADNLEEYIDAAKRRYHPVSTGLTGGTYAMTLGLNISSAVLSLANLPLIAAPYFAVRYGGLRKVSRAMGNAHRLMAASGKERVVQQLDENGRPIEGTEAVSRFDYSLENVNFSDPANRNVRHFRFLQETMREQNIFQQSYTNEILDAKGALGPMQTLFAKSGIFQHLTENYSRQISAISAYELELQKRANEAGHKDINRLTEEEMQAAAREAVYLSELTNGSVTSTGAPLMAQGNFMRLIYLYKRHGLAMFNLLYHTLDRSQFFRKSDRSDPDYEAKMADIRMARMQFASVMGSVALFSGAQGIPMFATVAALYNLFAPDDEEDFETLVRTGIGELGYNGILNYVLGVDVASRIGLSGMFYRPSFNQDMPELFQLMEGIGGPVLGVALRITDRAPNYWQAGDYARLTETLMPTSMANVFRGIRFATEGAQTMRGDPIVGDVGALHVLAQSMGFMPAEYLQRLEQNTVGQRIDQEISNQRTRLLRQLYTTRREGDMSEYRRVLGEIRDFSRRQIERGNPAAAIDAETIADSLRSHERTTSRMHNGVLYSSTNDRFVRQILSDWSPSSIWAE